jgi:putative glutamine amidotransferase
MTPATPNRPRIGIPWRTSEEEAQANRPKILNYEDAVGKAGAEPVLLSLADPERLQGEIAALDGFVLPGSPADVEPAEYGEANHGYSAAPDQPREATDRAVLKHAFAAKKPVLAICYGCQLLNVYLGGTLIQDLRLDTGTNLPHSKKDLHPEPQDDPRHGARFEPASRLGNLAGAELAEINSSHHQAIARPGQKLRVTAYAIDGTIEAVEWTGDDNWVVGVQWHPERMANDEFAARLFEEFVAAARRASNARAGLSRDF